MDLISENTRTASATGPVFYAGRFADRMVDLPGGPRVLDSWDVPSARLDDVLGRASNLVVLDPFSFPFEALEGPRRDAPLILVLPHQLDTQFLNDVFGEVAFGRLGFFDRVATADDALWEKLRWRYGWAGGQRIALESGRPEEAAGEVAALLEAEEADEDGTSLHRTRPAKARHRAQGAVIEPQFVAARGNRAESVPFAVLGVGGGIGRWAASFDLTMTRFVGTEAEGDAVEAARGEYPEIGFEALGGEPALSHDDESFDMVFSVDVMHRIPTPAKRALLSEMWRVTRPGGRLILLEEFVTDRKAARSPVYPMPVGKFVGVLLEATAGQVVLEHMESLRYPQDDLVTGGLLSLSRLGVPGTW